MGSLDHLLQQHRELLQLAREIAPLLEGQGLTTSCTKVRLTLSAFTRKLRVHAELEERFIYSRAGLARHSDPAVAGQITRHRQATQALVELITSYVERWDLSRDTEIETSPTSFMVETKKLFDETAKRFELEEAELYVLIDRSSASSGARSIDLTENLGADERNDNGSAN